MKICILCGKETKFGKKSCDGYICKDCRKYVPQGLDLSGAELAFLKPIYEENKRKAKDFETTSKYGMLYLDGVHNLFCLSKGGKSPNEFHTIYHISELTKASLFISDIRNIGTSSNRVVCNTKIAFQTEKSSTECILVQNETCPFTVKGDHLECHEPPTLSAVRCLFNQMIENEYYGAEKKLKRLWEIREELRTLDGEEWARGIFFFEKDEKITKDELRQRRKELMKIYHPDNGMENGEEFSARINRAYQILEKM
jgi:hypothetical protein